MEVKFITREQALSLLRHIGKDWKFGKPEEILEHWVVNRTYSFDIAYGCRIMRYETIAKEINLDFSSPLGELILIGRDRYDLRACFRLIGEKMIFSDFVYSPPIPAKQTDGTDYGCSGPFTYGNNRQFCLHGWNVSHYLSNKQAQETDRLSNAGLLPGRQTIEKV